MGCAVGGESIEWKGLLPCSPAVPVLLTAGDWILTSMAISERTCLTSTSQEQGQELSSYFASRELPERKGQERKKEKYELSLDIFKHGIG